MATKLKLALVNQEQPAYRIAIKVGISESRLSKLSSGLFNPKVEEAEKLAQILNCTIEDIFPKEGKEIQLGG